MLSKHSNNSFDIYLESPSIMSSKYDNSFSLWLKPKSFNMINPSSSTK